MIFWDVIRHLSRARNRRFFSSPAAARARPEGRTGFYAAWAFAFFLLPQITVAGLLRSAYAATEKTLGIIALYLVIFWALPPLADLALQTARPGLVGEAHTALLACSPVGAWIAAALWVPAPMLPGLILHLVLAGGALYLAHRAKY